MRNIAHIVKDQEDVIKRFMKRREEELQDGLSYEIIYHKSGLVDVVDTGRHLIFPIDIRLAEARGVPCSEIKKRLYDCLDGEDISLRNRLNNNGWTMP